MKILLVNKFYYRRGGDCIYTLNLEKLLKSKGHDVAIFAMQCRDNYPSQWSKYWPMEASFKPGLKMIRGLMRPFGTKEVEKKFTRLLEDFKPDVVHVGNIHSQISPIVVKIAHERDIKVVWTIHDYKLLCPRYDFLKKGQTICEECLTNSHSVVDYNCVKNSKIASYLGYKEALKWNVKNISEWTDDFICASDFVREMMVKGGFPKAKVHTIVHSVDTDACAMTSYSLKEDRSYYCFIGRLSHEKGVKTLIEAANQLPYNLIVIGDGPIIKDLKLIANDNIDLVGFKNWEEIKKTVSNARFCVTPSEWYEVLGLVNLESLCLGTPVLGARIGGIPELIEEGVTGMTFKSGNVDDLKDKILKMFAHDFDYQAIAKDAIERYSSEAYYHKLMEYYK